MKEKRGNALKKKINVSSYLNPGCNGGQWVFPSLLQDGVHPAVMKLGRGEISFPDPFSEKYITC